MEDIHDPSTDACKGGSVDRVTYRDFLIWSGWKPCPNCGGNYTSSPPLTRQICPKCAKGLVPPEDMISSIIQTIWDTDGETVVGPSDLREAWIKWVLPFL